LVTPHFPYSPKLFTGIIFFGELNVELLGACLPLWFVSLGNLGP
jgi:hypothetical protein